MPWISCHALGVRLRRAPVGMLPGASEPELRFQESGGFGYHRAMAENRDLIQAQARLDALTDWERRPRNTMRVGLEPMRDLAAASGRPAKVLPLDPRGGHQGQGVGLGLDRGGAGACRPSCRPLRLASCRAHHRAGERTGTRCRRADARARLEPGARRLRGRAQGRHARGQRDLVRSSHRRRLPHLSRSGRRMGGDRSGLGRPARFRPTSSTARSQSSPTSRSSTRRFWARRARRSRARRSGS